MAEFCGFWFRFLNCGSWRRGGEVNSRYWHDAKYNSLDAKHTLAGCGGFFNIFVFAQVKHTINKNYKKSFKNGIEKGIEKTSKNHEK